MRVAVDGRALTGRFTGDRTYWRNLLRTLPGLDPSVEYLVYSRAPIPEGELPYASNMKLRVVEASNDRLWTLIALPKALRQDRADLVHVQYTAPLRGFCPCPIVTTVHDISFRLYPEWFPLKDRLLMNLTVPSSMRRAAHVITDSESSRRDILAAYRLPPEKLKAIPLGLSEGFPIASPEEDREAVRRAAQEQIREAYGITAPFLLTVSVFQPRKNLRMLAEAFGIAKAKYGLPHQLVMVGKMGWGTAQSALREAAAQGGGAAAAEDLVFPGYVEDADLPIFYRACVTFAHPALYEGFGIPPLEAMACAAPTLVSDAPALPEVVGDAGLVVPARDAPAWADAMHRMLTDADLRRTLSERGLQRVTLFTWQKAAQQTLEIYRQSANVRYS